MLFPEATRNFRLITLYSSAGLVLAVALLHTLVPASTA
jgi:hypothetical protein